MTHVKELSELPRFWAPEFTVTSPLAAATLKRLWAVPHLFGCLYFASGSATHLTHPARAFGFGGASIGTGFHLSEPGTAITKCLFELNERIWGSAHALHRFVRGSHNRLKTTAVSPRLFSLLSPGELSQLNGKYLAYDENLEINWVESYELVDGKLETCLFPAFLTFPGYSADYPGEKIVPTVSAGMAAGRRYDESVLRGLCEVLERDALAIRWLKWECPPQLPASLIARLSNVNEVSIILQSLGFTLRFNYLTLEIDIPIVMCTVSNESRSEQAMIACGLGCAVIVEDAIEKAFMETLSLMSNYFTFSPNSCAERNSKVFPSSEGSSVHRNRILRFTNANVREASLAPSLSDFKPTVQFQLKACLAIIKANGQRAFFTDLTPRGDDIESKFTLIRAHVTGLQPLLYETDAWRVANPRMLPKGNGKGELTLSEINRAPHPLHQPE